MGCRRADAAAGRGRSRSGVASTSTPAASSARRLASKLPRSPLTIAPAWPILLPGGEAAPAMNATTGFAMPRRTRPPSSSIAPPISPIRATAAVRGSRSSRVSASRVVVPRIGSPPMPMKAEMPSPARTISRQASVPSEPLREITPTAPGAKIRRSNAGMKPTKHSPGVTRPAVFGPITAQPASRAAASTQAVSCSGTCSVRTTSFRQPASIASSAAALTPCGGMNSTETSNGLAAIAALAHSCTGTPQHVSPARLGLTPPTTRVP